MSPSPTRSIPSESSSTLPFPLWPRSAPGSWPESLDIYIPIIDVVPKPEIAGLGRLLAEDVGHLDLASTEPLEVVAECLDVDSLVDGSLEAGEEIRCKLWRHLAVGVLLYELFEVREVNCFNQLKPGILDFWTLSLLSLAHLQKDFFIAS